MNLAINYYFTVSGALPDGVPAMPMSLALRGSKCLRYFAIMGPR